MATIRNRIAAYIAIAAAVGFNLISYAPLAPGAHTRAWGDALNYYAMSEHTGAAVDNPFALRMLSPFLVRQVHLLTGLSLDRAWLAFTAVALVAAIVAFFEFLTRMLDCSAFMAMAASLGLAWTWWFGPYAMANPYLPDPVAQLVVVVAVWLALARKLWWFIGVLAVGAVNKETALLLAPLYPVLCAVRERSPWTRDVWRASAMVVVLAAAYIWFRVWAQWFIGGDYRLGAGQGNDGVAANVLFALSSRPGAEHGAVFGVFGALWVLFAYGLYLAVRNWGVRDELVLACLWFAGCCAVGRLAATDTERVFVMLAPLVLAVVALLLDLPLRDDVARLWALVVWVCYVAVSLRWVPAPAVVFVDLVALGAAIACLTTSRRTEFLWATTTACRAPATTTGSTSSPDTATTPRSSSTETDRDSRDGKGKVS